MIVRNVMQILHFLLIGFGNWFSRLELSNIYFLDVVGLEYDIYVSIIYKLGLKVSLVQWIVLF